MSIFLTLSRSPRLLRAAFVAFVATGALLASMVAAMGFWFLPNIADYRDDAAALMSRAVGQRVTLDAISAEWKTWRPEIRMDGMRLYDADGDAALHLPRLVGRFSWRSLLVLAPRFSQIELSGLALDVRRAADGRIFVGGVVIDPASPDGGLADWLLRQGEIRIDQAQLRWLDQTRRAPPLVLEGVSLRLTNFLRRHVISLRATPPAPLARPLAVEVEFAGRVNHPESWRGTITARSGGLAFAPFRPWLVSADPASADTDSLHGLAAYLPQRGWSPLDLTLAFAERRVTQARVVLDARAVALQFADGLPVLDVARLRGAVVWQQDEQERRIAVEGLRVQRLGAAPDKPLDLAYHAGDAGQRVVARELDLVRLREYAPYLPLPDSARTWLASARPRGALYALDLAWRGAGDSLALRAIRARANHLSVDAVGTTPGVENLSGEIEGDAGKGRFEMTGSAAALNLPGVFREPRVPLATLAVTGGWSQTEQGLRITLDNARFANADLEGAARGWYETRSGQAGHADIRGEITRADGRRVYRYLPVKVGDLTVNWLKSGILAGGSRDVKFGVKGDLERFPFTDGSGEFFVDSQITDGVIQYAQGWPRIDGVNARMLFERGTMRVETRQARIYGVSLLPVTATIPDLMHHEELLVIDGIATGPASDFVRFANFSPVGERLRGTTRGLVADGTMRLALRLNIPLRHSLDTTVAGRLQFQGGKLAPPALPPLTQVRGVLTFTHDGLSARAVSAQLLGGPVSVNAQTLGNTVKINAAGRVGAAGLQGWLPHGIGQRLSGHAAWRGTLDLMPDGETVRIESGLVGLASSLPAPLAKSAASTLPLQVLASPDDHNAVAHRTSIQLGDVVAAHWRSRADGTLERGELRFGGSAQLPDTPGLRVAGQTKSLDLSGWLDLVPATADGDKRGNPGLGALDVSVDRLDFQGRRFDAVRVSGQAREDNMRLSVKSPDLDGTLNWRPAAAGKAKLVAHFSKLALPRSDAQASARASTATATAGAGRVRAADFPAIELDVEAFSLDGREMGRLELAARGAAEGLKIDKLTLVHPDSRFSMRGLWRDGGSGETRAQVELNIVDAGRFLTRFTLPNAVARGEASFKGELDWQGSPADFSLAGLAGTLDFNARKGQFLKVEPGAGKLLGILSLQSLPRRLSLDFRDLFSDGYAFDTISATMRVARGVVYSDDFRMTGPAARVEMSGLAALEKETVQLRVKVAPKLSDGVSVAGALLGGPIAGLGAFAAQKLLRDPLEAAASREFLVSGAWAAPNVEKWSKPPLAAP